MNTSTLKDLTTPLLGTLPSEADIECQDIDDECRTEQDDDIVEETAFERFLAYLLPFLLLAQFGSAFGFSDVNEHALVWKEVFCSIMIFAISTVLFRRTLRDENIRCALPYLVPEMVTLVVCGLVYFHLMSLAFIVMVGAMMMMALFVIFSSIHLLWLAYLETEDGTNGEESTSIRVV